MRLVMPCAFNGNGAMGVIGLYDGTRHTYVVLCIVGLLCKLCNDAVFSYGATYCCRLLERNDNLLEWKKMTCRHLLLLLHASPPCLRRVLFLLLLQVVCRRSILVSISQALVSLTGYFLSTAIHTTHYTSSIV